ncbi:MAG: serine hydrolase domain-containing protein, partial [Pseudoclavibacter sp.]
MTTPQDAGLDRSGVDRLVEFVDRAIDAGRVGGATLLLARHGRIGVLEARGSLDAARSIPMPTDALFRLYSMTKPIVSVALLQLYEEGRFQLSDPLDRYLPELGALKVHSGFDEHGQPRLVPAERTPTVLDAMRHTAGFASGIGTSWVDEQYRARGLTVARVPSLHEEIRLLGEMPLLFHPGERWSYGLGHDVQALLVERLSGLPLDEYLDERLFQPLGMRDTGFAVREDQRARVVELTGESAAASTEVYERFARQPFGTMGLWGTALDFARFGEALRRGGELGGARILARKTVQHLATNQLPDAIGRLPATSPAPGAGYGLGVSVTVDPAAEANLGSAGAHGWFGAA